jgi:hypothetical protein
MWTVISCVLLASLCAVCAAVSVYSVAIAGQRQASLVRSTRSLESRVQSLETSSNEWTEELRLLANRVKMQRVRTAVAHTDAQPGKLPDPYKDPDGWRNAMNKRLAASKLPAD